MIQNPKVFVEHIVKLLLVLFFFKSTYTKWFVGFRMTQIIVVDLHKKPSLIIIRHLTLWQIMEFIAILLHYMFFRDFKDKPCYPISLL